MNMSATMFRSKETEHHVTKIPVLTSPPPLRRSTSLRLRNDRVVPFRRSIDAARRFEASPIGGGSVAPPPTLRRGNSFIERGSKGHGARLSSSRSGSNVTTEGPSKRPQLGASSPNRTRSLSLSLSNTHLGVAKSPAGGSSPKTPPVSPDVRRHNCRDWDTESVNSEISVASSCDHACVALNGTTFSGRSMKYVVHCNQHAGATGEDYLTPTQRAHRQVKRLKLLLQQAQKDLEQKDNDIVKLTKEVVELRLYKAALSSPEDKSNSSDAVTVRENPTDDQATPDGDLVDHSLGNHLNTDMTCSYADSGHFDDFTNSSIHSKDSAVLCEDYSPTHYKQRRNGYTNDKSTSIDFPRDFHLEHQELITEYEKRLQELIRTHEEDTHQIKQKHNDKVEELLQRITEINSRYWQLVPELDSARDRIKELEKELDDTCRKLEDQEQKHKKAYLQMYNKGQEAANVEQENKVLEIANQHPSRISVPELLHQLQVTQSELENIKDIEFTSPNKSHPLLSAKEAVSLWVLGARKAMYRQLVEAKNKNKIDPEITLQFLKSAIYYFLTDKENSQGHLRAIQSILGFSLVEIDNIDKCRTA